jgi:hypothetical protein
MPQGHTDPERRYDSKWRDNQAEDGTIVVYISVIPIVLKKTPAL